jgi:polyisoprenoid-binding protein YceI
MARSRATLGLVAGAAVLVLVVVGFAGWYFFVRDDAPEEASIEAAAETLDEQGDGGSGSSAEDPAAAASDVDGTWAVDTTVGSFDDFSGTWAGYRIDEELGGIGAQTAVGRSPNVSGTLTVENGQVTAVDVDVDLTALRSDSAQRDGSIRSRGLQSDQYPTASFTLTDPLEVPDGLSDGQAASAQATGELTLHGVTKPITVDVDAQMGNGTVAVTGSAPIKLTDFGIEAPTGFRVLSIQDDGTFEFQIFFVKQ